MKIVLYTMDSRLRASLEALRAGSFSFLFSGENLFFAIKDKTSIDGGDSACPPGPPLNCAIMLYYLFRSNRIMGAASAAGARGNICRSPQER
jgi:hypothetical protein